MKSKFIYAFSEEDKNKLSANGYKLLNKVFVSTNYVYVFENKGDLMFEKDDKKRLMFTNTLMF